MPAIDYSSVRADFVEYLHSKKFNERYVKESILSYLDRFVTVIKEPMDVVKVFAACSFLLPLRAYQHFFAMG